MSADWVAAFSGLVGAGIGGYCTLVGVQRQQAAARADQQAKEQQHHKAILQAIHDEVETVWELYMASAGAQVLALQPNQPYNWFWPVSLDYFTIYTSNAIFLGHLPDNDLRKSIIRTYSIGRALIDSYRLNNGLVERHSNAALFARQQPTPVNQEIAKAHWDGLTEYAATLKKSHERFEEAVNSLLRSLRKTGVLSEKKSG